MAYEVQGATLGPSGCLCPCRQQPFCPFRAGRCGASAGALPPCPGGAESWLALAV